MLSSTISTTILLLATLATAVPIKMGSTTGSMAISSSGSLYNGATKRTLDPLDAPLPASIKAIHKSAPPSLGANYIDPVTRTSSLHRRDQQCTSATTEDPIMGIPLFKTWTVELETPYDNQSDGCGRGFLDNYRGRCGSIEQWGCDAPGGSVIQMSFMTSMFCTPFDITEATKAASGGRIVNCADE